MSITKAFEKAFFKKESRGWDHIYVAVDVHETIFEPTYKGTQKEFTYYFNAQVALRTLSKMEDVKLILFTSSYSDQIGRFLDKFEEDDIHFDFINENPMEKNTEYACFDKKFYFNVIIDDKAGFEADSEWYDVFKVCQKQLIIKMMKLDEEAGLYAKDGSDGSYGFPLDFDKPDGADIYTPDDIDECNCESKGKTVWQLTSDGSCMRCGKKKVD
jgi:hypothetical protein